MLGQNFVPTPHEARDRVSQLKTSVVQRVDSAKLENTSKKQIKYKDFSGILSLFFSQSFSLAACGVARFIGGLLSFRMAPWAFMTVP